MENIDLEKNIKNKERLLSPSFKRGVVKDDIDEFKLDLLSFEEDESSPSPQKRTKKELKDNREEYNIHTIKNKDSDEIIQKKNSSILGITSNI